MMFRPPRLLFSGLLHRFVFLRAECALERRIATFEATFEMQHSNPARLGDRPSLPRSLSIDDRAPEPGRNTTPLENITSLHFPEFSSHSESERALLFVTAMCCFTHAAFCIIAAPRSLFPRGPEPRLKDHRQKQNGQLESLRRTDRSVLRFEPVDGVRMSAQYLVRVPSDHQISTSLMSTFMLDITEKPTLFLPPSSRGGGRASAPRSRGRGSLRSHDERLDADARWRRVAARAAVRNFWFCEAKHK